MFMCILCLSDVAIQLLAHLLDLLGLLWDFTLFLFQIVHILDILRGDWIS
jgi:hypothetical protein